MSKKIRYFLTHLSVSFVLACLTAALVTQVWYPQPLFAAADLGKIFFLLLAIDVIVGPLFSLLVYKEHKKTLKFDLTVVALVQFCAFVYGLHTIAEGRPAWLVFNKDRVELVRVNEIDEREKDKVAQKYQTPSWFGPQWVKADLNTQTQETQNQFLLEEGLSGGGYSIAQSPLLYAPFNAADAELTAKMQPLAELKRLNGAEKTDEILAKYPQADGFLPLKSGLDMTVLLDSKQPENKIVKIVDLRPW